MEFLPSLAVLLVTAKSIEWLFEKLDIHPIVAHVLTGIILGPFLLGLVEPTDELRVLADFGLIMMMLYMGLTSNFSAIAHNTVKALIVASLGVAFSFALGFLTVLYFSGSITAAIFVGVALGNTAIEVTSGVLAREHVTGEISSILMGAAFADDIMAVYLIGIVTALAGGGLSASSLGILTVKIFAFIGTVLIASEYLLKRAKWFNSVFRNLNVFFTFTLILTFSLSIIAQWVGLNQIIGAYLAGLMISRLKEKRDPLVIPRIKLNALIGNLQVVLTEFFIPLFFIYVGLMFNPPVRDLSPMLIGVLYLSAVAGKLIGCGLGSRLSGLDWRNSILIGIGMGGRGSLELAILTFGLNAGLIDQVLFAGFIAVSMLTALTTPVFFKKYLERIRT
ncbi:sodium:proton antiporter [Thermococcus sp. P6]|uniref:cation:proton antiporter n=1 Tax=Thermococcus sp. P6 TaxID=122420 RepID=UPI000B59F615|nr:cation:proton antiporter [Thermococcus sp. P6]ASJ09834.1 sodium:proton antiporter [Thermococcus sp. P6]